LRDTIASFGKQNRRELLRQPHGFEGLGVLRILADFNDASFLESVEDRTLDVVGDPAYRTASPGCLRASETASARKSSS
jgi:hypothetical protein